MGQQKKHRDTNYHAKKSSMAKSETNCQNKRGHDKRRVSAMFIRAKHFRSNETDQKMLLKKCLV